MKYPDHADEKENASGFAYSEHLRFSTSHKSDRDRKSMEDTDNDDVLQDQEQHNTRYSGGSNYHHNKRMSRTSAQNRHSNGTRHSDGTRQSSSSSSKRSSQTREIDSDNVIALFGAYGVTGHYFLKLALEAGYHVRALVLPGIVLDDMQGNDNLTLVTGTFDDEGKIHRVVRKASYVVCMLNDCDSTLQNASPPSNFGFIQKLVPIIDECSACKVLLYQVGLENPNPDSTGSPSSDWYSCLTVALLFCLGFFLCSGCQGYHSHVFQPCQENGFSKNATRCSPRTRSNSAVHLQAIGSKFFSIYCHTSERYGVGSPIS
jgi:hypothetical protein